MYVARRTMDKKKVSPTVFIYRRFFRGEASVWLDAKRGNGLLRELTADKKRRIKVPLVFSG